MEETILIVLILLTLLTTFCLYKMLDKRGLYFSIVIMSLIAFVMSFKNSVIFKLNINLGIIPLLGMLNTLYLSVIKYGEKDKKNLIIISLVSNITTALLLAIMNFLIPAITETISINMQGTFEYNYKILIVYPIIVAISQYASLKLFNLIQLIQDNITVGIVLTYIITGLIYTIVFTAISYIKILEIKYSLFLGISTYILGLLITIINTSMLNILLKKKVI